jgi:hypothetical protein
LGTEWALHAPDHDHDHDYDHDHGDGDGDPHLHAPQARGWGAPPVHAISN